MAEIDQFYMHEALDRTAMIASIVEEHLTNHPAILLFPAVHAEITTATTALLKAYQLLAETSREVGSHS